MKLVASGWDFPSKNWGEIFFIFKKKTSSSSIFFPASCTARRPQTKQKWKQTERSVQVPWPMIRVGCGLETEVNKVSGCDINVNLSKQNWGNAGGWREETLSSWNAYEPNRRGYNETSRVWQRIQEQFVTLAFFCQISLAWCNRRINVQLSEWGVTWLNVSCVITHIEVSGGQLLMLCSTWRRDVL